MKKLILILFLFLPAVSQAAVIISITPSRDTSSTPCLAPCAVFFDAIATTDLGVTTRPFHDLDYTWDFGDPDSGVWATDNKSKNLASGAVAAHVFELPDTNHDGIPDVNTKTFNITLTVRDGVNPPVSKPVNVRVDAGLNITAPDYGWTTYFVSNLSGNDTYNGKCTSFNAATNCGPLKTFGAALGKIGPNTRILFKRTESFSTSSGKSLDVAGPGIIGAYFNNDGSDNPSQAKPTIVQSGSMPVFTFTSSGPDWRIMDLSLNFTGVGFQDAAIAGGRGNQNRSLILRVNATGFPEGVKTSWPSPYAPDSENFVVDSDFSGCGTSPEGNGMYYAGKKSAILGTTIIGIPASGLHVVRIWHADRFVVAHNVLMDPILERLSFKLHNEINVPNNPISEYIVISDNKFRGHGQDSTITNPHTGDNVHIGPQYSGANEQIRDVILERNTFLADPYSQSSLQINAVSVTVRNNLFNLTGTEENLRIMAVEQTTSGVEPAPRDISIYNNVFFKGDDDQEFVPITLGGTVTNAFVQNNIASIPPNFTGYMHHLLNGNATTSNNLFYSPNSPADCLIPGGTTCKDPSFVNPLTGNFRLNSNSPAKDTGTSVPVFGDWDLNLRPVGAYDLGAFELGSGGGPPPDTKAPAAPSNLRLK